MQNDIFYMKSQKYGTTLEGSLDGPNIPTGVYHALVDGVNPCSLWVLTMLLALVLHSGSRRRVMAVGGTFLLVTSLMYGLYIVGSRAGERRNGMTINFVSQVSMNPKLMGIGVEAEAETVEQRLQLARIQAAAPLPRRLAEQLSGPGYG